ncbi:MAG: ATPase domain-containing protein [Polyangiaceae bacterium]
MSSSARDSALRRLANTGVVRLERIFSPAGIPLVRKSKGGAFTTSIAVRGGAGCGKTTLALALALSLADASEGAVLHLTTELDPVEVALKAEQLGLSPEAIQPWGTTGAPARVYATHLSLGETEEEPDAPAARKFGALQYAWDLLHADGQGATPRMDEKVRVLVIDAFAAPQPEESQDTLRRDMVALVQALESEGISTLLVEETLGDAPSFLPFVVDIVFELAWVAGADTGELTRRLRCTKCRHAVARPGPHDYGLEDGKLSVWPDVLLAVAPDAKVRIPEPLRLAHLIDDSSNRCAVLTNGGVLPAPTDGAGHRVEKVVSCTPGAHVVDVACGTLATISDRVRPVRLQWTDDMGISALGWMLVRLLHEGANVVVLHEPHRLIQRAHDTPSVMRLIDALRGLGAIVVLSASDADLRLFSGMSDLPGLSVTRSHVRRLQDSPYRTAAWRFGIEAMIDALSVPLHEKSGAPAATENKHRSELLDLLPAVRSWQPTATNERAVRMHNRLHGLTSSAAYSDVVALLLRLLGQRLPAVNSNHPTTPWVHLLTGYTAHAYHKPYREGLAPASMQNLLWAALAATQAGNRQAIRVLEGTTPLEAALAHNMRLQAIAAWEGLEAVRSALSPGGQALVPDQQRHVWEAFLGANQKDLPLLPKAHDELRILAKKNGSMPILDRADMAFNLGLSAVQLGHTSEAARHFASALHLNPMLEGALTTDGPSECPAAAGEAVSQATPQRCCSSTPSGLRRTDVF